ncbi:MAG: class I SAM-dependent methyltransferase, partial [Nanoarchaeota archaeon]|nr:class I SAM-dependent methyltransferase [Nanoarchaeota archaeon]
MKEKIKEAVKTYNKIAELYAKYNYEKLLQFQLSKFISLLPGKKVLDVGCGMGRDVEYFMEEKLDVIGIDLSKKMIDEAKTRVKKGKFKVMDFTKMSFKEKTFDGIWSMAAFFHIPRDHMVEVLKEMSRVLKKDGVIYIAVKEGEGEKEVIKSKYKDEPRVFVLYQQVELETFLKETGF